MTPNVAARGSALRTALGLSWVLLIGVTAVGHATALRNTLTVLVPLVTLSLLMRDWRAWPCKRSVAALVVWALASLLWSLAPDVTLGKLRTDLLLPLLAAIAAFHLVRDGHGIRYIVGGFVLGLIALSLLSAFAYVPAAWAPASLALEQNGGIVRPLPHWYPGPGDASMFALLSIAPLYLAWSTMREQPAMRRWRAVPLAALLLAAFVLVTTNNRNAVVVAPLVLVSQWLLDRRIAIEPTRSHRDLIASKRRSRHAMIAIVASIVAIVAVVVVLELGARERLAYLHQPLHGDSAALELVENDTRPVIWRYYLVRALEHPWIGVGFGRTVPGIAWHTEADRQLAHIEPNAYIHAHDLLLNWWLQLGAVGVALLIGVIASLVRAARDFDRAAGRTDYSRRLHHALLATLLATFARNFTDDFLVYGMATAFSIVVAALMGELSRLAAARRALAVDDLSITSRRSPSGPS